MQGHWTENACWGRGWEFRSKFSMGNDDVSNKMQRRVTDRCTRWSTGMWLEDRHKHQHDGARAVFDLIPSTDDDIRRWAVRCGRRADVWDSHRKSEWNLISREGKILEDSQTSPARPYDRSSLKMKPLNGLEAVVWDKRCEFMVYLLEQHNLVVFKARGLTGINVNRKGSMNILGLENHLSISLNREHRKHGQSQVLPDSSWPLTSNQARNDGNPNASLPRVVLL